MTCGGGATSIGAYHEAMNLAALWRLPLVFVCQNNGWAEHTPLSAYAPATDLAARAGAYNMPAVAVDGFDPIETWRVRTTGRPSDLAAAPPSQLSMELWVWTRLTARSVTTQRASARSSACS